jgi:hypothetical protein
MLKLSDTLEDLKVQEQNTQSQQPSNVVSLFQRREQQAQAAASAPVEKKEETFEEIAARNKKNADRMAKERANANKSVLRSYRIKN